MYGGDGIGDIGDMALVDVRPLYYLGFEPGDTPDLGFPHGGTESHGVYRFEYMNYVVIPTNNPYLPDPSKLEEVYDVKLVTISYANEMGYTPNVCLHGVRYNNEINAWCLYYGTDFTEILGNYGTDYPVVGKVLIQLKSEPSAEPFEWFSFTRFVDYRAGFFVEFRKEDNNSRYYADVYTGLVQFGRCNDTEHFGRGHDVINENANMQDAYFNLRLDEAEQPMTSDYNPEITPHVDREWAGGVSTKEENLIGFRRKLYTDVFDNSVLNPSYSFEQFKSWYKREFPPKVVFVNESEWYNIDSRQLWGNQYLDDTYRDFYWISNSYYLTEKALDIPYLHKKGVCVIWNPDDPWINLDELF